MAPIAGQAAWPARGAQGSSLFPSVYHFFRKRTPQLTANAAKHLVCESFPKNIFIFGLGYTSIALGNWLASDGWRVSGTCRTPDRVHGLRAKGWAVDLYDPAHGVGLTPELSSQLESSPYVLSSVPPLGLALYDPALSAQKALLRPLAASGRVAWFGYLSSTGVYGDWQGEWVDESSPCRQTSSKAIIRQEAEAAWLQMYEQYGLPVHVFRLGGIYGPGRSVLDSLQSEPADLSASQRRRGRQRYTARCHVYDICAVLAASMAAPAPGDIYNVVDDDPAPRADVVSYARALLAGASAAEAAGGGDVGGGTEAAASPDGPADSTRPPDPQAPQRDAIAAAAAAGKASAPTAAAAPPPPGAEGGGAGPAGGGAAGAAAAGRGGGREVLEEKRVRNARIRRELRVALRYHSFREGVAAIHGGEYWPLPPEDLRLLRLS